MKYNKGKKYTYDSELERLKFNEQKSSKKGR